MRSHCLAIRDVRTYTFPPGIPACFFTRSTTVFSPYTRVYVSLYPMPTWTSPPPLERICRLSSRCYCVTRGTTAFEMPPRPYCTESRANVIIFRNLLSRCSHCARLCRGRSLFSPPFLASTAPFLSPSLLPDLLSPLIEPSSRRVDQRQDFFPFPFFLFSLFSLLLFSPVHTSSYSYS